MAQTLSNGYIKPDTGDRGGTFFPDLESNIVRVNGHNHKGTDSEKLDPESFAGLTDTTSLVPANWVLHTNGLYRAPVTMPGNKEFDTTTINLRLGNNPLYGDIEKITANTFYAYVNDPSISVTILYL